MKLRTVFFKPKKKQKLSGVHLFFCWTLCLIETRWNKNKVRGNGDIQCPSFFSVITRKPTLATFSCLQGQINSFNLQTWFIVSAHSRQSVLARAHSVIKQRASHPRWTLLERNDGLSCPSCGICLNPSYGRAWALPRRLTAWARRCRRPGGQRRTRRPARSYVNPNNPDLLVS